MATSQALVANSRATERFLAKIRKPDGVAGCWIWVGAIGTHGYGVVGIGEKVGRTSRVDCAHRVAYRMFRGDTPAGMHLDHLCRNHECVNPWHLELVTPRENTLRGAHANAIAHNAGTCTKGHPVTGANAKPTKRGPRCRTCYREMQRKAKARRRHPTHNRQESAA